MKHVMVVLFLALTACGNKEVLQTPFKAENYPASLIEKKKIPLESYNIVYPSHLQTIGDQFSLVGSIGAKTCYLFNSDGSLSAQFGKNGQGPGEYPAPFGMTATQNYVWVVGAMNHKIHLYDFDGNSIKDVVNPVKGIITTVNPLKNDHILLGVYSRYSEHCLFEVDEDGTLIQKHIQRPEEFNHTLDTFDPPATITKDGDRWLLTFNFAYEVQVFDADWTKQETLRFASIHYVPPAIVKAFEGNNHKNELEYRATFTQVNGMYPIQKGYATYLKGWEGKNTPKGTLEFWDQKYNSLGNYSLETNESFIGVFKDSLVFFNKDEASLVFRQFAEMQGT